MQERAEGDFRTGPNTMVDREPLKTDEEMSDTQQRAPFDIGPDSQLASPLADVYSDRLLDAGRSSPAEMSDNMSPQKGKMSRS